MSRKQNHKPSFIKVMLGTFRDRLRIPPLFAKHFQDNFPQKMSLKVSTRICWNTKLRRVDHNVFLLGQGWKRFVQDNSIEFGDILHFKFCGASKFRVTIYDHSCCEKKKTSENVAWAECQNSISEKAKVDHNISSDSASPNIQNEISLDSGVSAKTKANEDHMISGDSASPDIQNGRSLGSGVSKKSRKKKEYPEFKSDYPFFLYQLPATSVKRGFMNIPHDFVKTYLPKMTSSMKIVDQHESIYTVFCNGSKKGYVGSGWKAVVIANDLKEDTMCAFELIDEENVTLKLSVVQSNLA